MGNTLNLGNGNWGVKDSSLLGYKKRQNGRFLPETFDVARGSAGTRVNQSGLIETVTEILSADLITNGDFTTDTDWTKQDGWTISGGKANANMVLGGNGNIYQTILTVGKTYKLTFTVSNYVQGYIRNVSQDGALPLYNSNGTFTEYFVANTSNLFMNASTSESTQLSIDNISVVEVNRDNLARIDYTDDAAGVLLTEPQSTNLRQLSNTYVGDATIRGTINNDATEPSPSGVLGVEYLTATSANGLILDSSILTGDGTFSVYLKRKTGVGDIRMSINGGVSNTTMAVTNEWKRFSISSTTGLGQLVVSCLTSGDEVYIWGWQEEALSYPTSLIPTVGVVATRLADVVNNAGDVNNFNSEEGVLFVEISALGDNSTKKGISISDGTISNRIILRYGNQLNKLEYIVVSSGAIQANMNTFAYDILDNLKIAVKFKENDFALWVNGLEVATDTSGSTFPIGTLSELNLDSTTLESFYGKTKNIQVFDEALSDAELQTLTTI